MLLRLQHGEGAESGACCRQRRSSACSEVLLSAGMLCALCVLWLMQVVQLDLVDGKLLRAAEELEVGRWVGGWAGGR